MEKYLLLLCGFYLIVSLTTAQIPQQGAPQSEPDVEDEDEAERPGFKLRITQSGLDYINTVTGTVFRREITKLTIPDIHDRVPLVVAKADVSVTNIQLREFSEFHSRFVPVSGLGVRWSASEMWPVIQADYRAKMKKWFVDFNKSGSVTITWRRGMSMVLEFMVDRDEEGKPTVQVFYCRAGGRIKVRFRGGWSEGLNVASSVLKRKIADIIYDKICEEATREINSQAAWALSQFSVRERVLGNYEVDFSLLDTPDFNTTVGIESNHKGVISSVRRREMAPPFNPPVMAPFLDLDEHMAYAFISSYLLNTGLYAAWANNQLEINVTHDKAPEDVRKYFSLSCPADEMCFGSLYPGLSTRYPEAMGEVNIRASRSPEIHFRDGMISLDAGVDIDVFVQHEGSRELLVGANINVEAELTVRIENRKVMFNVTQINPTGHVRMTSLQSVAMNVFLQSMLGVGTDRYLVPFISKIGTKGIDLPDIPQVRLLNPVVLVPYDVEGVMIIGADLYYEGLADNAE